MSSDRDLRVGILLAIVFLVVLVLMIAVCTMDFSG